MCGAPDQLGHERPVLIDRLCDNIKKGFWSNYQWNWVNMGVLYYIFFTLDKNLYKDCDNGADEDGSILGEF